MIEIKREEFKKDKLFSKVHEELKKIHKVPDYTIECLMKNRHIKDFCEESRHFVLMHGKEDLYLHYDVFTWILGKTLPIRVDAITFYDDFEEYEAARVGQLYSAKDANIPDE
jgi:hypothetical protein